MRSNWLCLRLLGLLAILAASSVPLRAQYIYSTIEAGSGYVWSESVTDVDYSDEFEDAVEAYVGATLNGPSGELTSGEDYDDVEAIVSLEAAATQSGGYFVEGDHYVLIFEGEDFFPYWEEVGGSEEYTVVTVPSEGPPILWGISPMGGTSGQDGYIQIYGENLAGGCSCGSVSFGEIVYESEGQINVYYPPGESPGTYYVSVSTPSPPASGPALFTITTQDPTPQITSISPGSLPVGATTSITVTGVGFGTSPNLYISGSGISYSVTGAADTVIYAQVSVASNAPYEPATVTVTSDGYWGNGFIGTNSPTSAGYQVQIAGADPTPVITGISPTPPWQAGTSFTATVSGSGFGSNPSFSIAGALITFTSYGGSDTSVSGYVSIDPSAPTETATVTVSSNGYYGYGFKAGSGNVQTAQTSAAVNGCLGAPVVSITTRPMKLNNAFPDPGLPYHATLTAAGIPSAANGTYLWTTSNSSMIQFDNPNASTVNVTVQSSGVATITVKYSTACGSGTDSLTFVLTDDVTVIGYIDAGPISLPSGASSNIVNALTNPVTCGAALLTWEAAGQQLPSLPAPAVTTAVDRSYANAFLNSRTANSVPLSAYPTSASLTAFVNSPTLYRAFNRLRVYYETGPAGIRPNSVVALQQVAVLGQTPEPCSGGQILALGTEAGPNNNTRPSSSSMVYQLAQGRIGTNGQQINAYLNQPQDVGSLTYYMATPYIWSAIEFDANGNLLPFNQGAQLQIFPTYYIYRNGIQVNQLIQSALQNFVSLDWTSAFAKPF